MGDIMNVVTSTTTEKITVNRHGPKEHMRVMYVPTGEVVIEAWEDHKYVFWMSKTRLLDKQLNGEIFDLVSRAPYDYVAYEYKLISMLQIGEPIDALYAYEIPMEECKNGAEFATYLINRYESALQQAVAFENQLNGMAKMQEIEKAIAETKEANEADYTRLRAYIEKMWEWEFLKLSPNTELRRKYLDCKKALSYIYDRHMDRVR